MGIFNRIIHALRPQNQDRFDAPIAPETGFFVIGDIHGCDDLLARCFDKIDAMTDRAHAPIICVGDYIDRGEQSAAVLRRLYHRAQRPDRSTVCLMGNHEDMFLRFLDNPEQAGAKWLRYGGLQTLTSFRIKNLSPHISSPHISGTDLRALRDAIHREIDPEIIAWMHNLPAQWQSGNMTVVHAGADPDLSMNDQMRKVQIWGHSAFGTQTRRDNNWVIHGHTIVPEMTVHNGVISLDTGAYATGVLTAIFVSAAGVELLKIQ